MGFFCYVCLYFVAIVVLFLFLVFLSVTTQTKRWMHHKCEDIFEDHGFFVCLYFVVMIVFVCFLLFYS